MITSAMVETALEGRPFPGASTPALRLLVAHRLLEHFAKVMSPDAFDNALLLAGGIHHAGLDAASTALAAWNSSGETLGELKARARKELAQ